jgi:trehalose 6-phosphate phosphatase
VDPDPSPLDAFRSTDGRAGILLDFDGTLSPIVARPELARIAEGARETLAGLVGRYAVVAVISGRTHPELVGLVGVEGVRLEASYGMPQLPDLPASVLEEVRAAAATIPSAHVEPKGHAVAVHVRGAQDPEGAEAALRDPLERIGAAHGLDLIEGKRVLELIPAGLPLKEGAVERVAADANLAAVLYAGDDVADLRAFAALDRMADRGVRTVKVAVRGAETPDDLAASADLTVDGPDALVELLRGL